MAKSGPQGPYGYSPSVWRMIGRGMELGAIIGGLTYVGYLGDEHYGTGPWLTLTGAVLATVGGSYNLVKEMLFPARFGKHPAPGSGRGSPPGSGCGPAEGDPVGGAAGKRVDSRDGSRRDDENH